MKNDIRVAMSIPNELENEVFDLMDGASELLDEALQEVKDWIPDLETCGYKIYHTTPYVLQGETLLFLGKPDLAKEAFYQAIKYGATKRDFSDKPAFYFDMAKEKLNDNEEILNLFRKEISSLPFPVLRTEPAELSEELTERIEVLSEQGNDLFEEEKFQECILRIYTEKPSCWKLPLEMAILC